uniref:Uncharacterized protein n=1 Tax=Arundo donax TaxID=35708 RepID=A0A0A9G393_ARUDO
MLQMSPIKFCFCCKFHLVHMMLFLYANSVCVQNTKAKSCAPYILRWLFF